MVYPTPARLRMVDRTSREYTVMLLSLRKLWHEIFDACPGLLAWLGAEADGTFDDFVDAAFAAGHPMDWTLHLELGSFCALDREPAWRELCVAAARRWVRECQTDQAWVALRCASAPGRVFIATRPRSLDEGPRIVLGRLVGALPDGGLVSYQTGGAPFVAPVKDWVAYWPLISRTGLRGSPPPGPSRRRSPGLPA